MRDRSRRPWLADRIRQSTAHAGTWPANSLAMGDNMMSIDDRDLMTVWGGNGAGAVQAALSRLGAPYVYGACGPNQFDCSGLVRWAYGQAGVQLDGGTAQ